MSIKLEVGKKYVTRNGGVGKVFAKNDANVVYPYIVVLDSDPSAPQVYTEDGLYIASDINSLDLIAEAPQVVDVWFAVSEGGEVLEISLYGTFDRQDFYKTVGPVKVEAPR